MSSAECLRILVVDDDEVVLETTSRILASAGHTVETRVRALGTTPYVLQTRPDFVLLDVEMPGLDGLELARAIRERFPRTHVVLFSSKSPAALQQLAQEVGALGAIPKGLRPSEFLRRFGDLVAARGR